MTSVPVTPRPAAAVVLARDTQSAGMEVFMVRRHGQSPFMPNVYVFPGGTVQDSDRAFEEAALCCTPVRDALGPPSGFRLAAIRECFEEAGVLLADRGERALRIPPEDQARFAQYRTELHHGALTIAEIATREGLTLATGALLHWSHWITPEISPRRFDTHFFLAIMPEGQEAAHDLLETTESLWLSPGEALARYSRGGLGLVFATIRQLEELAAAHSTAEAWQRFTAKPVRTMRPYLAQQDGNEVVLLPDDT